MSRYKPYSELTEHGKKCRRAWRAKWARDYVRAKTEKEHKKVRKEHPKAVAEYFDAVAIFRKQIEQATICVDYFAPESLNFVIRRHEKIKAELDGLENTLINSAAARGE